MSSRRSPVTWNSDWTFPQSWGLRNEQPSVRSTSLTSKLSISISGAAEKATRPISALKESAAISLRKRCLVNGWTRFAGVPSTRGS
jgi:hypothetical protein